MVGILSRHLRPRGGTSCGAGKGRRWKVRRGFGEALSTRGLRERRAHRALVERAGSLGRCWRRVLHEVRVRRHVSAVAMVARAGGSLGIVVVRGNGRLGRRRPQVGGSVVLWGAVLTRGHPSSGTTSVLMERHDCGQDETIQFKIDITHENKHTWIKV